MADDTPTGRRVLIPEGADGSFLVFKNGAVVQEGVDFDREPDALVFREPLNVAPNPGLLARIQMTTVGIGVYNKIDDVDIHATRPDGSLRIFTELHAIPGS
ncbi:MAG: hypothetical protein ACR2JV_04490 [Gaiellales bacterium]